MKHKVTISTWLLVALFLTLAPIALGTTWYVNGVSGSDKNHCISSTTPCKTIGHAIALASSGDTIRVGPATYIENLFISFSLNVSGSGAATTIIDGGGANCPAQLSITGCTVVTISTAATVVLSGLTIRNGSAFWHAGSITGGSGGGIYNSNGTLIINNCTVSGNVAKGGIADSLSNSKEKNAMADLAAASTAVAR